MQVPQWDVCTYLFCFLFEYYILSSHYVFFYIFSNIYVDRFIRRKTIHYLILSSKNPTTKIPFKLYGSPGILRKNQLNILVSMLKKTTKKNALTSNSETFLVLSLKPDLFLAQH